MKLAEIAKYPFISREETSGTRKEIERLLESNKISCRSVEGGVGFGKHRIRHNRRLRRQRHKHHQLNCRSKSPSCRASANRQNSRSRQKPKKTLHSTTQNPTPQNFRSILGLLQRIQIQKPNQHMHNRINLKACFTNFLVGGNGH